MDFLKSMLSIEIGEKNQLSLLRYILLEGSWILINLSYCDQNVLKTILDDDYDILHKIRQKFKSDDDLQLLDQFLFFFTNVLTNKSKYFHE